MMNKNTTATIPDWLKNEVIEAKESSRTSLEGQPDDKMIREGNRNAHLASLAGSMRRRDMSEDGIMAALLEENKQRCDPPLDESEVKKIAESIAKYPPEEDKSYLPSQVAAALVTIGMQTEIFHDEKGEAYTAIDEGEIKRIYCLRRSSFKEWLSYRYYTMTGKAPGQDAIKSAVGTLSAMANCECDCHVLGLRFARTDDAIWIDLCDDKWRAVKVTENGWEVVAKPPILFTRHSHMLPLPEPERGGSIDDMLRFINVKNDNDKLLLKVYCVTGTVPTIPKPILIVHGTQGSGKSYACHTIRDLLDPSAATLLTLHSDEAQFAQNLAHHAVPVFDNQGVWKRKVSDMLCKAATGSAFQKRKLYTDDDDIIMSFKRPVILNGISIPSDAPDFMDRSILIELERISQEDRKTESSMKKEFEVLRPKIFGAMLDVLSKAIGVEKTLDDDILHRMADFCRWGKAAAIALGHTSEEFDAAMEDNAGKRLGEVLCEDPLASALESMIVSAPEWMGTATELLARLEQYHDSELKYDRWPKNPAYLAKRLRELQPLLLEIKVEVKFLPGHSKSKRIVVRALP